MYENIAFYLDERRRQRVQAERRAARTLMPYHPEWKTFLLFADPDAGMKHAKECDPTSRVNYLLYGMVVCLRRSISHLLNVEDAGLIQVARLLEKLGLDRELDQRGTSAKSLAMGLTAFDEADLVRRFEHDALIRMATAPFGEIERFTAKVTPAKKG